MQDHPCSTSKHEKSTVFPVSNWSREMKYKIALIVFLTFCLLTPLFPDEHYLWDFTKKPKKENEQRKILTGEMFLLGQIKLYQMLLSDQQGDACNFTPSCSHFAYNAIKQKGTVRGVLLAIDRLQRCNPWSWNYYGKFYNATWVQGRGYKLIDTADRY